MNRRDGEDDPFEATSASQREEAAAGRTVACFRMSMVPGGMTF
jgi:hypothetical protein